MDEQYSDLNLGLIYHVHQEKSLRGLDTPVRFSAVCVKGDNLYSLDFLPFVSREITFVTSCLFSCTLSSF